MGTRVLNGAKLFGSAAGWIALMACGGAAEGGNNSDVAPARSQPPAAVAPTDLGVPEVGSAPAERAPEPLPPVTEASNPADPPDDAPEVDDANVAADEPRRVSEIDLSQPLTVDQFNVLLGVYCVECHSESRSYEGSIFFDTWEDLSDDSRYLRVDERMARLAVWLEDGTMPPDYDPSAPQPAPEIIAAMVDFLKRERPSAFEE